MRHRVSLVLTSVMLMVALWAIPASAATVETDFTFDNTTGTITKYTGTGTQVDIPAKIGGVAVKKIGDGAFGQTSVTNVTIPSGVEVIGIGGFWGCEQMQSVTIPESVTDIQEKAFYGCKQLKAIKLPSNLKELNSLVFWGCRALTSVDFPPQLKSIGDYAFTSCGFTSMEIPDTVTKLGPYAFNGCRNLKSVKIPGTIPLISAATFAACQSLKDVTISEGVSVLSIGCFLSCPSLETITIPASVKVIILGDPFRYCSNLSSIYFKGNAPETCVNVSGSIEIPKIAENTLSTIYHKKSAVGFGETWKGRPTGIFNEVIYSAAEHGRIDGQTSQNVVEGANSTQVVAVPEKGYHFVGWSDGVTTATRIDSKVTKDISVTANFEKDKVVTYTLAVVGGTGAGSYNASTTATVSAVLNGKQFGGWKDESGNILSYNQTYSFIITRNITLTAVLSDTSVTAAPSVTLDNSVTYDTTSSDYVKMYFLGTFIVPKEYQIIDNGFVSVKNTPSNPGTDLTLQTSGATIMKVSSMNEAGQAYRIIKTTYGATFYVRGYMTYKNTATGETVPIYSPNVVQGLKNK